MVDDTTKVKISKQDITNGKELPGATLQIIDENGNIVEEYLTCFCGLDRCFLFD